MYYTTHHFIILSLSEGSPCNPLSANVQFHQQASELQLDAFGSEELCKPSGTESQKRQNYVSQSAVALRCRVMPPPCIKNPYLNIGSSVDLDIFGDRRSRYIGEFSLNSAISCYSKQFILFMILLYIL